MPYVVESRISGPGAGSATARVYVATEERAIEISGAAPGRTYREIAVEEMPAAARENLLRAQAE